MSTAVGSPSDDHRAAFRELVISHPVEAERVILGLASAANRLSDWLVQEVLPPGSSSSANRRPEIEPLRTFLLRGHEIHANMVADEQRGVLGDPTFRTPPVQKYSPAILKVESTSADEKSCRRALVKIFRAYPEKVMTKAQLKKLFPGVGNRPFERAFRSAGEESGAHTWSAAGRPRKSNQDIQNRIASLINRDGVF